MKKGPAQPADSFCDVSDLLVQTELLVELGHASAGIHQLLLAREERMAVAANIHLHDVPVFRGSRLERSAAGTNYRYFVIFGMYIGFHFYHLAVCVLSIQMLTHYSAFFFARQLFLSEFAKNSCKNPSNALY